MYPTDSRVIDMVGVGCEVMTNTQRGWLRCYNDPGYAVQSRLNPEIVTHACDEDVQFFLDDNEDGDVWDIVPMAWGNAN